MSNEINLSIKALVFKIDEIINTRGEAPIQLDAAGQFEEIYSEICEFKRFAKDIEHQDISSDQIRANIMILANNASRALDVLHEQQGDYSHSVEKRLVRHLSSLKRMAFAFLGSNETNYSKYWSAELPYESIVKTENEFSRFKETYRSDIQDLRESSNLISSLVQEKLSEAEEILQQASIGLKEKQAKLDRIYNMESSEYLTKEFKETALDERTAANQFRWGAIGCLIVMALAAIGFLISNIIYHFDLPVVISGVALTFVLSVAAAYMAKESAKHREMQHHCSRISMDISAIDLYIAGMPDHERFKLKAEIARKLFGKSYSPKGASESFPIDSQQLLLALINKLDGDFSTNKKGENKSEKPS